MKPRTTPRVLLCGVLACAALAATRPAWADYSNTVMSLGHQLSGHQTGQERSLRLRLQPVFWPPALAAGDFTPPNPKPRQRASYQTLQDALLRAEPKHE